MRLIQLLLLSLVFAGMSVVLYQKHQVQLAEAEGRLLEVDLVQQSGAQFFGLYFGRDQKPIGIATRIKVTEADGSERSDHMMVVKLKVLGKVQEVQSAGSVYATPQGKLSKFDFFLNSQAGNYSALGEVVNPNSDNRVMNLTIKGSQGDAQRHRIKLPKDLLFYDQIPSRVLAGAKKGMTEFKFSVLDPASMGISPVAVKILGHRKLKTGEEGTLISYNYKGVELTVLVDERGQLLSEQSPMGFFSKRISSDEARKISKTTRNLADIAQLTGVVPTGKPLKRPREIRNAEYTIKGINFSTFPALGGTGQTLSDGKVLVHPEIARTATTPTRGEMGKWLSPTLQVQSDHPSIKKLARRLTKFQDPRFAAKTLSTFVYDRLEKTPVVSVPSAIEILRQRRGDCNEHATLYAALARAANIPTKVVGGIVFLDDRFLYHAWNEVWVDSTWVSVDSIVDQIPVDATHIKFLEGPDVRDLDQLVGLVGTLKVEVLKTDWVGGN